MTFDWAAIIRIGLGDMGLKPNVLWSLSPVEFWTMAGLEQRRQSCMRAQLDALQKRFPDRANIIDKKDRHDDKRE